MDFTKNAVSTESMDLLSQTWCNSAIQVFQPMIKENSVVLLDSIKGTNLPNKSLKVEEDEAKSMPQWKLDDVKSWIWLQKTIHPELEYDLCFSKKWFSRKINPWKGLSIKKWVKEMKQEKKEKERLQKAEVHAAISLAGVAAALAAIAAENAEPSKPNALKDSAVASAAALVAAQCAQVAEVMGAKSNLLHSTIAAAMTATDASDIITLTAAAATSLRGAGMLRGRAGNKERSKDSAQTFPYDEFQFGKCRESLAKGDELPVGPPNGNYRQMWVSIVQNNDGKVLLKVKKKNVFMALSRTTESTVCRMETNPYEEHIEKRNNSYYLKLTTNNGKIELLFEDCQQYMKWIMSINHMLILSTTLRKY